MSRGCENCFCRFEYIYDYCPYCGTKYIEPKELKKIHKIFDLKKYVEKTLRTISLIGFVKW